MANKPSTSSVLPLKRKATSEMEKPPPSGKPVKSKRVDDGESDSYSDESEDKIESKDDIEPVAKPEIKIFPGFQPNDVTLVVEEKHLHLNKDVLSSASPVFEAWLKKEWQQDECSDDTKRELETLVMLFLSTRLIARCENRRPDLQT
ncbi:hypothetical protein KP79_PYT23526 [Mizuhopecten yessoensis]|uniref:BTB domain-containing protein n=1 Tax=Mizuhopecten yessoensis TaxID=6573 RepID=A0A210PEQ4_MIZYE|nr:hypothetical protein KP79_PYT23526 [Mizuhopecten yessoensis]